MKYIVILFLGCLPLMTLTALSLVESVPSGPTREESRNVESQIGEAQRLAKETLDRVRRDRPAAKRLANTELFGDQPVKACEARAATKALDEAIAKLQQARKMDQLIVSMKGVPVRSPAWLKGDDGWKEALSKTKVARNGLDGYISKRKIEFVNIDGADGLFSLLEKRRTEMDREIAILTAVRQGGLLLRDGNAPEAIAALNEVSPAVIQDAQKREQVTALIRLFVGRAQYRIDYDAMEHTIEGIESFLKQHPDPPGDSEAETKRHQDLRDELTQLRIETSRKERIRQLESGMADMAKEESLSKLIESAERFKKRLKASKDLEKADKVEMRKRARDVLSDWLTNVAFPRKRPPAKLMEKDNREAIANHRRYIGKFQLDDQHYYLIWFWDGKKDPIVDPQGDDKIDKMQVPDPPDSPRYVHWADAYNSASDVLARGGDPKSGKPLRQQWKAFFEKCKSLQKEYDEYQSRWGTLHEPDRSCKDWSFLPDSKAIPHRNLDDLGRQLESLWRVFQP